MYLCTVLCFLAQSCLTVCDSMDCSPPGSSAHEDSPSKNIGVGCLDSQKQKVSRVLTVSLQAKALGVKTLRSEGNLNTEDVFPTSWA